MIREMVIAINESFGEGTAELVKLGDNEGVIRFAKGEMIRIEKEEKGELVIQVEGDIVGREEVWREEEETEKVNIVEELGRFINVVKEEVISGKILEVREQIKRFYKIAYERGINGVLSTEGLIYELDEYRRREGVREIEGVSIEVISKMPRGVQDYLFARVLGRGVEISRLGEKTRAVVTAIVEIGHIFMASEDRGRVF